MTFLELPFKEPRRLPFYLAMEEWAARELPADEYFFSWRVRPTVICGRNQEMDKEVNREYCREAGIDVVRRKSGGGCVYADMDNFMFSYISPGDEVTATFARYTTMIASALSKLGLDAVATGRNDILVNGKKVSGNAFYHAPGKCIAHGTMLYDFDPAVMGRAITPSRAKLESKSVKSVESRVTCLKEEGISLNHEDFEKYMISSLCDKVISLSEEDVRAVEKIEESYYEPSFLNRKGEDKVRDDSGKIIKHARIEGVGEMSFIIVPDADGRIGRIEISGDFFLTGDPESVILSKLHRVRLDESDIKAALEGVNPSDAIAGLTNENLIGILTSNPK